jgi:hypothetical protein
MKRIKKIDEIANLPESGVDSEPKWDKGTQRTYLLKRITRVWIFSCIFYASLLIFKGFYKESFPLPDYFIHEVFAFICISGLISIVSSYYFNS